MKRILICLCITTSLFAIKVSDVIPKQELDWLKGTKTKDEIIAIAKERYKNGVTPVQVKAQNLKAIADAADAKEKDQQSLYSDEKDFKEYCLKNASITNSRGELYYLNLCISTRNQLNKYVVNDKLLNLISSRSIEELMTVGGKALLKEEISEDMYLTTPLYLSKFIIQKELSK